MARARNIKPAFFTNDKLSECSAFARLLFIGLWTICDREGRLFDRPKKIKAEVLPYDDCNVDSLLNELHNNGFVVRYCVDTERIIEVVNFVKHQNPHIKEPVSTIPSFKDGAAEIKSLEKTGLAQEKTGLVLPLTESPILNPSSLTPHSETVIFGDAKKEKTQKNGERLESFLGRECPDGKLLMEWGKEAYELSKLRNENIEWEWDKFKDYWIGVSGKNAVKKDWRATWRNWVRKNAEGKGNARNNNQGSRAGDAEDRFRNRVNATSRLVDDLISSGGV